MKVAARGQIAPLLVMEALSDANKMVSETGQDVVHLSLGQPAKGVPQRVIEHAAKVMQTSNLGYTEAAGVRSLRERISAYYDENYGVEVPADRIYITVGSSSAFTLSLLAAFDAGDRIGLIEPCYPPYRNILPTLGLEPVLLRGTAENHYQPDVAMLEALDEPLDGLIVCSPSNPTGTVIPPEQYRELLAYAREKGIRILSDEIYHNMTYGVETETALHTTDEAIIMNSFSKYFLMAGWRLGWIVAPPDLVRSYESLVQNYFVSPPSIAQYAAEKVFDCMDELNATVQEYAKNRAMLLETLPEIGFTDMCPAEGAFYIYADVSRLTNDSAEFCHRMLHEARVVAVPGHDFDTQEGHRFIRMSYAGSEHDIRTAIERLSGWLA